jgi:Alpha/beta hydrolase domain
MAEDSRVLRARVRETTLVACIACLAFSLCPDADARVTKIVLGAPTFPYANATFGTVGQYEELDGVAYGEIDPADPVNAVIQDIGLAPRDSNGMVQYSTDVSILKPVSTNGGNQTMLFEIVNRGHKLDPGLYNVGATATNPQGDGFLESQGFTLVWAGWQADLLPLSSLITMSAPIAHQSIGSPITGPVRSEFILSSPATTQPILADSSSNTLGYATASLDNSNDRMTMRVHQNDARVLIPNNQWAYADCTSAPFPGVPNSQQVCLKAGFDTNHIYELVYTAKDPIVMGLGLAAIRDVGTFLRNASADDFGTPNPLAGSVKWSLLNGISQSGRLLRTYLQLGFNQDEQSRQVFDGMQPHIGAVRNYINVRFAQPGRLAGTQHTEQQYPGPEGPLTYGQSFDSLSGQEGALLYRCEQTNTCPKIVHTMSDIEYWESAGAYDTVDPGGSQDVDIPSNVRIYQFSSTQHGGFSPVAPLPTSTGICEQLPNANSYTYNLRALLVALQKWVAQGVNPPPSLYSSLARGTLVPAASVAFPSIPNVTGPQGIWNTRLVYQRGQQFNARDLSGVVSSEPPVSGATYATLLPQVNADGNDLDGLRSVTLMAPLGTYTGWNVRGAGFSQGDACDLTGSYIPFALTLAQRQAAGDARPSLQERYHDLNGYATAAKNAVAQLVSLGYLLPADQAAAIASAVNQAQQAGLVQKTEN